MENYSFLDDKHHLGYVFIADTVLHRSEQCESIDFNLIIFCGQTAQNWHVHSSGEFIFHHSIGILLNSIMSISKFRF